MMDRYQPEHVHVIVPESTALDVNADRRVKDADPESLFSMACELDPVKSSDPIASAVMAYVRARADSRLPDCECAGCRARIADVRLRRGFSYAIAGHHDDVLAEEQAK